MGYSFLLFAIILTGGYVAYYTYMILRDLNANKGDANKDVETFEVKPEKQSSDSRQLASPKPPMALLSETETLM
jgi:hypothetical protein